jgi:hypothetical protein
VDFFVQLSRILALWLDLIWSLIIDWLIFELFLLRGGSHLHIDTTDLFHWMPKWSFICLQEKWHLLFGIKVCLAIFINFLFRLSPLFHRNDRQQFIFFKNFKLFFLPWNQQFSLFLFISSEKCSINDYGMRLIVFHINILCVSAKACFCFFIFYFSFCNFCNFRSAYSILQKSYILRTTHMHDRCY